MKRLPAVFALIFFLSGCVTTNATMLSGEKYPPLKPDQVTIYLDEKDIPRDYVKIAVMHASGSSTYTDERMMLESLRNKAAKIGANGVLLPSIKEPSAGAKVAAAFLGTYSERKGEAIAIFVKPE